MRITLKEAIATGKLKAFNARTVKLQRRLSRAITSRIFISIFERCFKEEGFGVPAGLTKKDRGMLDHLIKYLSEKMSPLEIADIAKNLVTRWGNEISEYEFITVGNNKMIMPTRPNLRAFLYCKNDILSFLTEERGPVSSDITPVSFIVYINNPELVPTNKRLFLSKG